MGDSGQAYKVDTLSRCVDDLHIRGILQVVRAGDFLITWGASIYSIGSGSQVYGSFLEAFPAYHGDIVDDNRFSSPEGRSVKEDYLNFRGHATGMRPSS